CQQGDTNPLTF
nr:immunoglobulin light chain junction region [Macaca mulatta]MOX07065.1 immunoglobulin light chain junction region [Macaca mulatta]MOX08363.1 immunoglobulin light chain junction region [Macaca mulatta]MOX10329.1 immunoglobulin light chain junction region [Macaca mulatta]MOX10983.1 immunoglobulin light chain junction region [Macaca mulatta]